MSGLFTISWRNVWRNHRRSLIIITAVALGLWAGIFAAGLAGGMVAQRFSMAIERQISHFQIHDPQYLDYDEVKFVIKEADVLLSRLKADPDVKAFSSRTLVMGMVASSSLTAGVQILGIDAAQEAATTRFDEFLVEGNYFDSEARNPVVIGMKLAEKMKVGVGSRVVLTFPDVEGEIVRASFRIGGIYQTMHTMLDEMKLYVRQTDLQNLVGQPGAVNEIAVLLNSTEHLFSTVEALQIEFPDVKVRSYAEVSPEVNYMQEMAGVSFLFIIVIILMGLAFGLVNTMLMTVYERTREFGMLMAVGMNKKKVFWMVMLETSFLTFTGAFLGMLVGIVTIAITSKTGVNLIAVGGDTLSSFGYDAIVFPHLDASFFLNVTLLVLATAIFAAIYPALKALKLIPAEAIRKD
jgi:putative ABC transport system permease protein